MTDLDQGLVDYLTLRQQQRAARVAAVWSAMSKRERLLVREVAVMANVLAMRRCGQFNEQPAADSVVVEETLSACLTFDDLYPVVARLERIAERRCNA